MHSRYSMVFAHLQIVGFNAAVQIEYMFLDEKGKIWTNQLNNEEKNRWTHITLCYSGCVKEKIWVFIEWNYVEHSGLDFFFCCCWRKSEAGTSDEGDLRFKCYRKMDELCPLFYQKQHHKLTGEVAHRAALFLITKAETKTNLSWIFLGCVTLAGCVMFFLFESRTSTRGSELRTVWCDANTSFFSCINMQLVGGKEIVAQQTF